MIEYECKCDYYCNCLEAFNAGIKSVESKFESDQKSMSVTVNEWILRRSIPGGTWSVSKSHKKDRNLLEVRLCEITTPKS